jgi:hypothetical protein
LVAKVDLSNFAVAADINTGNFGKTLFQRVFQRDEDNY